MQMIATITYTKQKKRRRRKKKTRGREKKIEVGVYAIPMFMIHHPITFLYFI